MPNYDEMLATLTNEGRRFFSEHPDMQPLMTINPTFTDGNCAIASIQAWKFCTQGDDILSSIDKLSPEEQSAHTMVEHQWQAERRAQRQSFFDEPQGFLSYLKQSKDGSVFCIDTEDHSYNVIKFKDDDIWIVDTSFGLYKQIDSLEALSNTRKDYPESVEITDEMKESFGFSFCEIGDDDAFEVYPGGQLRDFALIEEEQDVHDASGADAELPVQPK